MSNPSLTISPGAVRAWLFGGLERAVAAAKRPSVKALPVETAESVFPPFEELSCKAKAQVLVEVAGQLRAGVPAVTHQMSVIHQRRLLAVERELDAWLGRIAEALRPVSERGSAGLPKSMEAIRREKAHGVRLIEQLQCNIPAWGLTRGLQTFLRGCESL